MLFLGFQINKNKNLLLGLNKIPGFGLKIVELLLHSLGFTFFSFSENCRKVHMFKLQKLIFLLKLIFGKESLKQKIFNCREKLRLIKHRRAIRFFQKLPVRGQRTKTNAQTIRRSTFF